MNALTRSLTTVLSLSVLIACASLPKPTKTPMLFVPAPGSPIAVADGPGNVAIGDLNKDGKPDVVVASRGAITVLLGQGDGQLRATHNSPIPLPNNPSEMALGDVNGDGKLDLALDNQDSYGVMLLLGDGQGGFAPAPNSPIVMKNGQHPHTHGLALGDLNGDGRLDLVTANSNPDNDVSVIVGDGRGGFTPAPGSPFAVGPSPYPFALADLNLDGNLDIVATNTALGPDRERQIASTRVLTLLLGDGRGDFRRTQVPLRTESPWFVTVGDLNDDHRPDIVATHHERQELTVLLGGDKGDFTEAGNSPFDLGHAAWVVAVVDVNRDGKADIVAAAEDGVAVMLGNGQGGFKPAPGSPFATGKGAWRLEVGDVNGDGKPDVATSNLGSDSVSVLLGQ